MNVNIEKIPGSKVQIKVEIDSAEFKEYYETAFEKVLETAEVKGFRKGRVPRSVYLQRFGEGKILQEAIDEAVNRTYYKAVEENQLQVLANPEIDIDFEKFEAEKALAYTATVPVYPEVELGQYFGLEVEKESTEATPEEVERRIGFALNSKADLELVEDGTLEVGHTAVFDFEGFKDGVPFEGGKAENYSLEIGSGRFIPGFEEQMVGMKPDEEREIEVTFPEDYQAEELKGAKATFKIKLHEIKKKVLPELDDEFVKDLKIENVNTVDEYREYIRKAIEAEKREASEAKFEADLLDKVCAGAKVEIPEVLIEQRQENIIRREEERARQYNLTFAQLLAYQGMTLDQYKEQIAEAAKNDVLRELVLNKIIEVENINLTEEDFEHGYRHLAEHYGMDPEAVEKELPRDRVAYHFLLEKTIDLLKEKAIVK
ncbi:MAG TPA: trigger factor [Acholeplasmataceae bacterium]|nr:trigger factor [Acholeplasmataceae bacterium]